MAPGPREWVGFLALCVGMFMAILDIQIVASSLPAIQDGLEIPLAALSWVQTGYLVAEIIAIMISGWLSPVLSTGGLFALAVAGFTLASAGCALSGSFATLIAFRVLQGLCGGAIIPTAFTAGFMIFPQRLHGRATLIAGLFAMMAPTIGPLLGGYITETYDWPWLFLINLLPGVVVSLLAWRFVRVDKPDHARWRAIDIPALLALTVALGTLEYLLKTAPQRGWTSPESIGLAAICLLAGLFGVRRCLVRPKPLVDFGVFREPGFAIACLLNFTLGCSLYAAVYLLPLFLGFVRLHNALEIGLVMTVMGVTQLLAAPFAALAERRLPAHLVAGIGFAFFAAGLFLNGWETPRSDAPELFWPQVLRGLAVLFCLIPVTNVALGRLAASHLANASMLLNLCRNLGGAIGIAFVDTLIDFRPAAIGAAMAKRLLAGDRDTAAFVGLPLDRFHGVPIGPVSQADQDLARPLVEHAAATIAFNEAWFALAGVMLLSLCLVPLLRRRALS